MPRRSTVVTEGSVPPLSRKPPELATGGLPLVRAVRPAAGPASETGPRDPSKSVRLIRLTRGRRWSEASRIRAALGSTARQIEHAGSTSVPGLAAGEADRESYLAVKRELAQRTWQHVQHYADAKSAIVAQIVARAAAARLPRNAGPAS